MISPCKFLYEKRTTKVWSTDDSFIFSSKRGKKASFVNMEYLFIKETHCWGANLENTERNLIAKRVLDGLIRTDATPSFAIKLIPETGILSFVLTWSSGSIHKQCFEALYRCSKWVVLSRIWQEFIGTYYDNYYTDPVCITGMDLDIPKDVSRTNVYSLQIQSSLTKERIKTLLCQETYGEKYNHYTTPFYLEWVQPEHIEEYIKNLSKKIDNTWRLRHTPLKSSDCPMLYPRYNTETTCKVWECGEEKYTFTDLQVWEEQAL